MKETAIDALLTGAAMVWFVFSVSVLFMCIKANDDYLEAFTGMENVGLVTETNREEALHKVSYQQIVAQIDYPDREYNIYVNGLRYDNDGSALASDDVPVQGEFTIIRKYESGRICELSFVSIE